MLGDLNHSEGVSVGDERAPAAVTDVGCEREINEDRYSVIDSSVGRLWTVCDGMGGVQGGELAAQLAVDAIRRALESQKFTDPTEALVTAVEEANRVIVLRRQNPAFSSMGTTIVAALIHGERVVIGHAGDSRAYLLRGSVMQQLTVDHTYVQELVEKGSISEEEAMHHPQAHVLTKCLGAETRVDISERSFWLWQADGEEDTLILCTDGLYSHVTNEQIAQIASTLSPQDACHRLTELAKSDGGFDNITVAILPLGGQLRDEQPPAGFSPVKKFSVKKDKLSTVSVLRHALLATLLAFVGAVVTALVVMVKISTE